VKREATKTNHLTPTHVRPSKKALEQIRQHGSVPIAEAML
jgi:hypothetical protein